MTQSTMSILLPQNVCGYGLWPNPTLLSQQKPRASNHPKEARYGHIMPSFHHTLIFIGTFCGNDYTMVLTKLLYPSSTRLVTPLPLAGATKLVLGSGFPIYAPIPAQIPHIKPPLPLQTTISNYSTSVTYQWLSETMIYPESKPFSTISI